MTCIVFSRSTGILKHLYNKYAFNNLAYYGIFMNNLKGILLFDCGEIMRFFIFYVNFKDICVLCYLCNSSDNDDKVASLYE